MSLKCPAEIWHFLEGYPNVKLKLHNVKAEPLKKVCNFESLRMRLSNGNLSFSCHTGVNELLHVKRLNVFLAEHLQQRIFFWRMPSWILWDILYHFMYQPTVFKLDPIWQGPFFVVWAAGLPTPPPSVSLHSQGQQPLSHSQGLFRILLRLLSREGLCDCDWLKIFKKLQWK